MARGAQWQEKRQQNMPDSAPMVSDAEADFEHRLAELEQIKAAVIADITMARPVRLLAASLGEPDWPAMQLVAALATVTGALHIPFELVDPPEELLSQMDDAGINWRSLNLTLIRSRPNSRPQRGALPIL
jgi:hypothetical protein